MSNSTAPKEPRKRRPKRQKNQPILAQAAKVVHGGSVALEQWQQLPKMVLQQHCQKRKVGHPRYPKPRSGKGKPTGRCVVEDKTYFANHPNEEDFKVESMSISEEFAALKALSILAPELPLERKLPSPFKEHWKVLLNPQALEPSSDGKHRSEQKGKGAKATSKSSEHSSKPPKRKPVQLSKVIMSEANRQWINDLVSTDRLGIEDTIVDIHSGVKRKLLKMGFRELDIVQALSRAPSEASSSEAFSSAMDYLVLNVPEKELPRGFNPHAREARVVFSGNVDGDDHLKTMLRDAVAIGFPPHEVEKEISNDITFDALLEKLYERFYSGFGIEEVDDGELLEEEMVALDAIYGDEFKQLSSTSWKIDDVELRIRRSAPVGYPGQMPIILVGGGSLLIVQEFLTWWVSEGYVGMPVTYLLVEWVRENKTKVLDSGLRVRFANQTIDDISVSIKELKSSKKASRKDRKSKIRTLLDNEQMNQDLIEGMGKRTLLSPYKKLLTKRENLPIFSWKTRIQEMVRKNQVSIISAATGSGKSTQVGQFILEDMIARGKGSTCQILCTQPRRISATSLADRVTSEWGDPSGLGGIIGYRIRLESATSKATRLTFMTVGVLVRKLMDGDPLIRDVSHVIIDEVHERSVDIDLLLLLLRMVLQSGLRPDLRVILMSATLNAEALSSYYDSAPFITVPGRTFPVKVHHLEDVLLKLSYNIESRYQYKPSNTAEKKAKYARLMANHDGDENMVSALMEIAEDNVDPSVVVGVVRYIMEVVNEPGAILVFVPGMADIQNLLNLLSKLNGTLVLGLHSSLSSEDQKRIFKVPPKGIRKIVVSTNIAETSVTVEDIVFVIDCGRMNQMEFDPSREMAKLSEVWCSQANAKQRQGRAGRVQEGYCFRMYTEHRYNSFVHEQPPEIQRTALEGVCLQLKLLSVNLRKVYKKSQKGIKRVPKLGLADLLDNALDPPSSAQIAGSIKSLQALGALDTSENLEALGKLLAKLPVTNVRLGKMLIFGAVLRCLTPVICIAGLLTERSPFMSPMDKRDEANKAKLSFKYGQSDHLTLARAFDLWFQAQKRGYRAERAFCEANFLSGKTLKTSVGIMKQYSKALRSIGFMEERSTTDDSTRAELQDEECLHWSSEVASELGVNSYYDANASNPRMVLAVLCAGLYPNVASIRFPEKKYTPTVSGSILKQHESKELKFYAERERVFMHPSSVLFGERKFNSPFVVYLEKRETSKVWLCDASMASGYALLLFGGDVTVDHEHHLVTVDTWIKFEASAKIAVLVRKLRERFGLLLQAKFEDPELNISETDVTRSIVKLLFYNGLDN